MTKAMKTRIPLPSLPPSTTQTANKQKPLHFQLSVFLLRIATDRRCLSEQTLDFLKQTSLLLLFAFRNSAELCWEYYF